mgnify:CR=1 FL=1
MSLPAACLRSGFSAVFLTEFIDTTGSINYLLRTSVKRVALRANFNAQRLLAYCRFGFETVTAAASHGKLLVIWVDICFHLVFLLMMFCAAGVRTKGAHYP